MEINKNIIEGLYQKALSSFNDCIKDEKNTFLQDEISIPITSLTPRKESVKIEFLEDETSKFIFEIKIKLFSEDELIGYYLYSENEEGIPIDDKLIFT